MNLLNCQSVHPNADKFGLDFLQLISFCIHYLHSQTAYTHQQTHLLFLWFCNNLHFEQKEFKHLLTNSWKDFWYNELFQVFVKLLKVFVIFFQVLRQILYALENILKVFVKILEKLWKDFKGPKKCFWLVKKDFPGVEKDVEVLVLNFYKF